MRQLLIRDIEQETGRDLLVYFADCDHSRAQIDQTDDIYLSELLSASATDQIDLLIESNGGATDATEKICAVLRSAGIDLRVIVPRRAKSNGTVIAFCGRSIIMGRESELGPIDPNVGDVPADFIVQSANILMAQNPVLVHLAQAAILQTKTLATELLKTGMMRGLPETDIASVVEKLASRATYHSHGAVIDAMEAQTLGLTVELHNATSALWGKIWLLRSMYAFDCPQRGFGKLFESRKISSPVARPQAS